MIYKGRHINAQNSSYIRAVIDAGGVPFLIPLEARDEGARESIAGSLAKLRRRRSDLKRMRRLDRCGFVYPGTVALQVPRCAAEDGLLVSGPPQEKRN